MHAHYMTKWRIRHPIINGPYTPNSRDNAKLACHGPVCYKMEWIYTKTKIRGQGSPGNEKERKNDNWLLFERLILTCTIILMNDLGLVR